MANVESVERNLRKTRIGIVSSNKMDKTIVVEEHTKVKDPIYKKRIKWWKMNVKIPVGNFFGGF